MDNVVRWQRFEGAVLFVVGLGLFRHGSAELAWWIALAIFLAPDLSFGAYLFGPKAGAIGYNLVHVYAFGAALFVVGLVVGRPEIGAAGALCLAHSGFDRMLGYGLKSARGFAFTHLGTIGRAPNE